MKDSIILNITHLCPLSIKFGLTCSVQISLHVYLKRILIVLMVAVDNHKIVFTIFKCTSLHIISLPFKDGFAKFNPGCPTSHTVMHLKVIHI